MTNKRVSFLQTALVHQHGGTPYRGESCSIIFDYGADEVEVLVITQWESIEAVKGFAVEDINKAVVEPQAIAVLKEYDDTVRHFEIALDTP